MYIFIHVYILFTYIVIHIYVTELLLVQKLIIVGYSFLIVTISNSVSHKIF